MPFAYADRVKETSTTSGTGTITLAGAVAGYQAFSTAYSTGQVVPYCLVDGSNWEVGLGTYTTSGTTLSRDTVLASSSGTSKISLSGGTTSVFVTIPAFEMNQPPPGMRNMIHNGEFQVQQRPNTVTALSTTLTYVNVDRWAAVQAAGSVNAHFAPVSTSLPTGFEYGMQVGRASANTNVNIITMLQTAETRNSVRMQGQYVTLSFYAKAGANYSASGSALNAKLITGTGTDQTSASMYAGTWTGQASAINSSVTLTTSWQRFTLTVDTAIATSVTQFGVSFNFTPVGTAGADDNFYITGIQLELSPFATAYDYRDYEVDEAICLRYLYVFKDDGSGTSLVGQAFGSSTTGGAIGIAFKVRMRISPTGTTVSSASHFQVAGAVGQTATALVYNANTHYDFGALTITVASGWAAGYAAVFRSQNTGAYIIFTGAEM